MIESGKKPFLLIVTHNEIGRKRFQYTVRLQNPINSRINHEYKLAVNVNFYIFATGVDHL